MLADSYPQGGLLWTMLAFFLFFIWIWILISIFGDIFRSDDMGGWTKALWVIFVIVLPFLGILIYLIARGGKMQERSLKEASQSKQAFDAHVREVAQTNSVDQLAQLADLKEKGILNDAEFEAEKAKLLG
jgi:Na+-transporting methylmalonyl-CoA/oxaloacetate decarboxylase gamma subunit